MERWPSGRRRLTRNQVCGSSAPGVRIPLSPPLKVQAIRDNNSYFPAPCSLNNCISTRRDDRAVEGARLEIVCALQRGTEGSNPSLSASYRQKRPTAQIVHMVAGRRATNTCEPRQARKGATVAVMFVRRGSA